jgi:DNA-binding transcriptional ArsR family regulator
MMAHGDVGRECHRDAQAEQTGRQGRKPKIGAYALCSGLADMETEHGPPAPQPLRPRRQRVVSAHRPCPSRSANRSCPAGPISVSDLAAATGINDTTASQTLRYLRAAQAVATERDGRVIRYRLASDAIAALLPARALLPERGAVTEQG